MKTLLTIAMLASPAAAAPAQPPGLPPACYQVAPAPALSALMTCRLMVLQRAPQTLNRLPYRLPVPLSLALRDAGALVARDARQRPGAGRSLPDAQRLLDRLSINIANHPDVRTRTACREDVQAGMQQLVTASKTPLPSAAILRSVAALPSCTGGAK